MMWTAECTLTALSDTSTSSRRLTYKPCKLFKSKFLQAVAVYSMVLGSLTSVANLFMIGANSLVPEMISDAFCANTTQHVLRTTEEQSIMYIVIVVEDQAGQTTLCQSGTINTWKLLNDVMVSQLLYRVSPARQVLWQFHYCFLHSLLCPCVLAAFSTITAHSAKPCLAHWVRCRVNAVLRIYICWDFLASCYFHVTTHSLYCGWCQWLCQYIRTAVEELSCSMYPLHLVSTKLVLICAKELSIPA